MENIKIVDREYQLVEILVDSVWFKTLVHTLVFMC